MNRNPDFDTPDFHEVHMHDQEVARDEITADPDSDELDDVAAELPPDCHAALTNVQAFLHDALTEEEADLIRAHLEGCDTCLEVYDVESMITRLLRRSCPPPHAPATLRVRLMSMRITTYRTEAPGSEW